MPGSIHVSVIDFSGLPSSSPSSSILIKASMGKNDHQVWGKGDFFLPLTTLRDNMIVTIHDADGNEVLQTGVRIISIVEKGSLDESLSLKGGGIVHLKLRFVLNDEERNRIQRMRESAMKRKRDELLSISPRYSKFASTAPVPLPSCDNHEVAGLISETLSGMSYLDSRASLSQNKVLKIGDQTIQFRKGNEARTKEIIPYEANEGGRSKGIQLLNNETQSRSEKEIKFREKTTLVDEKEKVKDQIDVSIMSVMKEDSSGDKIETSIEQSTRLIDKNEMDQIDISNPFVTKNDSLDKNSENNIGKYEELVGKNLKEFPQINAPTIPEISKEGLSFSSAYLATPEGNDVEDRLEKTPNKNRADESEDVFPLVSMSQGMDVCDESLGKIYEKIKDSEEYQSRLQVKNEAKLYPTNFSQRTKNSKEASSNLEKDLTPFEVKKEGAVRIEKREPLEKTSRSVRKMISAFESSQFKETRPVIKPPPTKTEKVVLEASKDLVSKDNTKPTKVLSSKVGTPLVDEMSEPNETDRTKVEERNISSFSRDVSHFEEPSLIQTQAKEREETSKNNSKPTNVLTSEMKTPLVGEKPKPIERDVKKTKEHSGDNFSRDASPSEEPSMLQAQVKETEEIIKNKKNSAKIFLVEEEPSMLQIQIEETEEMIKRGSDLVKNTVEEQNKSHFFNLLVPRQGVRDTADILMPESEIPLSNLKEDSLRNTLENEKKTVDSWEHKSYSGETSSAWIFPEDETRICVTTEIKQVKDLVGTYPIEKRLVFPENVNQNIRKSAIYTDMNETRKKEPSNKSTPGAETSSGQFGQAIKFAVMVAFGSLILFTRQRNPR